VLLSLRDPRVHIGIGAELALSEVAPGNLYVALIGQLSAAYLALSNQFKPGSIKVIGFETAFPG